MNCICMCESAVCHHGDGACHCEPVRPAPIAFLEGEPMCESCIAHLIAGGFLLPLSPHATDADVESAPRTGHRGLGGGR